MSNTDDFDSPEKNNDLDLGMDQDMDFGEFEDKKETSLGDAWKNSPVVKFGLIGGGILIVVVLIALFGGSDEKTPGSVVAQGDKTFKEAPGTKEVSPTMKEALEEKNQERIDEAQKQGGSAMPTPIEAPKTLLDVPDDGGDGEDPLLRWKRMQEERARAQREQQMLQTQAPQADPKRDAAVQGMANGMSAQMSDILGKERKLGLQHMAVFDMSKLESKTSGINEISGLQGASTTGDANKKPEKNILSAGKIEYAQLVLEANSDIPGPVVALLASGPFSGAKLLGSFTAQDEYLVVKFTTLVTKKGTSVPIDAFAVDPTTSLTGVATDVDHRYFRRIVLPAAAKFVEGLGEAYSQTTTTTSQGTSTTTTTTEDLNTEQEFGKAVSEAAKQVSDVLTEDGKNLKPLVTIAAGTPLGILFMKGVTDQNIIDAQNGVNPGQATAEQNAQDQTQQQNMNNLTPYQQLQMGLQNQLFMQQGNYSGSTNTVPATTSGQ